ncbi:hypothetical protein EPN28_03970 [Patescibacteria group bacterium]|nr:MAG: hypothetical protein EPN28_03970 [Patescibacteria group bacterium]
MNREKNLKTMPRAIFVSHALLPDYKSSELISRRLKELGQGWPEKGKEPGFIHWLTFPVVPPQESGGRPILVDFLIIPLFADAYFRAIASGKAYVWACEAVERAVENALLDGVSPDDIWVGWGAFTKIATHHGKLFLENNPKFSSNSTHGDAGTGALVIEAILEAGFKPGFKVAVIGANGAIGDAVSRVLPSLSPASIMLVGREDAPGQDRNFLRLRELGVCVAQKVNGGQTKVTTHQDKRTACLEQGSDLVIVATSGSTVVRPTEVPHGALVLDITTPSACGTDPRGWEGKMVVLAGCGQFLPGVLPLVFGETGGEPILDVGAGGALCLWGCTGETISRAVFGVRGHLAGPEIPLEAVTQCAEHFRGLGFAPQPFTAFGKSVATDAVRQFVAA